MYGRRFTSYLLLKLDYIYNDHNHTRSFATPSVEHILPQSPDSKRLVEFWPGTIRSSQSLIAVDSVRSHAQIGECFPLCGEVLFVRRASCVADERLA